MRMFSRSPFSCDSSSANIYVCDIPLGSELVPLLVVKCDKLGVVIRMRLQRLRIDVNAIARKRSFPAKNQ